MGYKRLLILVEGSDDQRFFDRIVKPMFEETYDWVEVRTYARQGKDWVVNLLKSIEAMNGDYIFVGDINAEPCVPAKRKRIQRIFKNVNEERIMVVVKEIESWYLAGLDDQSCNKLGLLHFNATDDLTKEKFNGLIPKRFDSRIDFMSEILKHFSTEAARKRNKSFKYFTRRYGLRFAKKGG